MIVSLSMSIMMILFSGMIFMMIIGISQMSRKKPLKFILWSLIKSMLSTGLLILGLVFLNSYQYIMAYVIGHLFKVTPIVTTSDFTQIVYLREWFVILSVLVIGYVINIFFSQLTKLKYIFVAPFEAMLMAYVLVLFLKFSSLSIATIVMLAGVILGGFMSVGPHILTKLTTKDLYRQSTIGCFNYLSYFVCLGVGKLFGKCETSCEDVINKTNKRWMIRTRLVTILGVSFITLLLLIMAKMMGYENNLRLIILDQWVVEGSLLHLINLGGLLFGFLCFYVFYKLYISVYPEIIIGIKQLLPKCKIATDFVYQLQDSSSVFTIGFWCSVLGYFITLWYLSFYEISHVYIPNLWYIAIIGVVVAKMGDLSNGFKGALIGSFFNGVILTALPTFSYLAFQSTQLEFQFTKLDYYFIAQLLDILFIF